MKYCNKCGKEILSGELCSDCAAAQNNAAEDIIVAPQSRMNGFGKALTSTILSVVGFIFFYVAMLLSIASPIAAVFGFIFSLPLVIIPMIFGIQSIKVFKRTSAPDPKPVATLVLGIVGLAMSALTALLLFIFVFVVGVVVAILA